MATKSEKEKQDTYTKPKLREKLKAEIKAGDKGGKPDQWSARKSQLLVNEYEKAGGDYKNDKPTEAQKDLMEWTAQDWQTNDGKIAIRGKKTEQQEANTTKEKGAKHGEQFVKNTDAVKRAMKEVKSEKKAEKKVKAKTAESPSKGHSDKKKSSGSKKKTSKSK